MLENGPSSRYAGYFDIDWDPAAIASSAATVLMPVLGDHYGRVLEAGELRRRARTAARSSCATTTTSCPLSPRTPRRPARPRGGRARPASGRARAASPTALRRTCPHAARRPTRPRSPSATGSKELLREPAGRALLERDPTWPPRVDAELGALNADPDALDALLQRQNYRLAYWRTASEELDYRRFFDIETLVGLRVEDADVFARHPPR